MVNDLIDPVTSQWNPELVQQVFSQEDAAVILSMPICRDAEDFMVWHYDSKGIFSVKSAYRVWLITQDLKSVRSSGASVAGSCWMKDTWKKLWQLHCPAKVHHFLWRFGHNSHPLHLNIERRGVELDTNCVVCGRQFEDGGHLFFRCKKVRNLWRILQLDNVRSDLMACQGPLRVLQYVLQLPDEQKMRTVALLWCWWSERNKANHGEKLLTADEFQFLIKRHTDEWIQFF